jgi:hypothetical protein
MGCRASTAGAGLSRLHILGRRCDVRGIALSTRNSITYNQSEFESVESLLDSPESRAASKDLGRGGSPGPVASLEVRRHRVGTPSLITAVPPHPGAYLPSAVISPWLAAGQDAWRGRSSSPAAFMMSPAGVCRLDRSSRGNLTSACTRRAEAVR